MSGFGRLDAYLKECVSAGYFPGAVVLAGNVREDLFFEIYGQAQVEPVLRPMRPDAIFDLASLTKPIATATSILILKEERMLSLSDRLAHYFPALKSSPYKDATILQALVHTSGIPAWFPLYIVAAGAKEEIDYIAGLAPKFAPGKGVEYSCLNYILLGAVIERASGFTVGEFSRRKVFEPLGMKDTCFLPGESKRERFVTTEVGNEHEKEVCRNYPGRIAVPWRAYAITGEVHDGNAFYGFGGVSGNAGLFAPVADLARFIRSLLGRKSVISREGIELMIGNHTAHLDQGRGIGWGVASRFAGQFFSKKTFGHTGFTGVCIYADPVTELFVLLMTNSVHPRVKKGILDEVRPRVCDLVYEGAIVASK